jgi:dihydrolipoamide dehydrogenase
MTGTHHRTSLTADLALLGSEVPAQRDQRAGGGSAYGTSQLVIDSKRWVVGPTFTGPEVQDMLLAATFAIVGELTLDQLWHGIAPFPTRSEIWLNLLEAAGL